MRLLLFAAACLLLVAACTATSAAPVSDAPAESGVSLEPVEVSPDSVVRVVASVSSETYRVTGDSASAVRTALNRSGPYSPADGRVYDAITRWGMQWSFRYDSSDGCRVASATIEVVAVTVLPELADRSRLSAQTLARWDSYINALAGHEQAHVDSVLQGARALQAAIDASPVLANCQDMAAFLNNLGNAYVEAMRNADVAFDKETGHGSEQGAVFP